MNIQEKIYPAPLHAELFCGSVKLSGVCAEAEAMPMLKSFVYAAEGSGLFENEEGNVKLLLDKGIKNEEGYSIEAKDGRVTVRAKSLSGFVFAAGTLAQLTEGGSVPNIKVYDEPLCKIRGVHMYLPPSDAIGEFLRVLDLVARLKYNTVFLEIGGGVEYESHPEINDAWKRFCREAKDYYGGPQGLQASEAHWKDSTHVELAGGGCLKKSELLRIVEHIRFLGMELIPEIQGLSHAYYLTLAHPEIAEQGFEQYPDTWCPMNEKSYELYEDVARELYELLHFDKVSIGHDEIRILGKCPRCKDKSGAELVAHDLNRLHSIYEKMGVKMFMWGESLQNYVNVNGSRVGESIYRDRAYGRSWFLPETHDAIDMIPRDITMLDWQWGQSIYSTSEFSERGISFLYGNFYGNCVTHWQTLVKNEGFLGAEVSTWCVTDFNELGRNGWLYLFLFSSAVLWEQDYDDHKREEYTLRTNDRMPALRAFLKRGREAEYLNGDFFPAGGKAQSFEALEKSERSEIIHSRLSATLTGASAKDNAVSVNKKCEEFTLLHATDLDGSQPPTRYFTWLFRDDKQKVLGFYSVKYEDGVVCTYPVEYGYNIGDVRCDFMPLPQERFVKRVEDESGVEHKNELVQPAAICEFKDKWIEGVLAFADAYPVKTRDGVRTLYATTLKNRRPDVAVKEVKFYPPDDLSAYPMAGNCEVILYGVFA